MALRCTFNIFWTSKTWLGRYLLSIKFKKNLWSVKKFFGKITSPITWTQVRIFSVKTIASQTNNRFCTEQKRTFCAMLIMERTEKVTADNQRNFWDSFPFANRVNKRNSRYMHSCVPCNVPAGIRVSNYTRPVILLSIQVVVDAIFGIVTENLT